MYYLLYSIHTCANSSALKRVLVMALAKLESFAALHVLQEVNHDPIIKSTKVSVHVITIKRHTIYFIYAPSSGHECVVFICIMQRRLKVEHFICCRSDVRACTTKRRRVNSFAHTKRAAHVAAVLTGWPTQCRVFYWT